MEPGAQEPENQEAPAPVAAEEVRVEAPSVEGLAPEEAPAAAPMTFREIEDLAVVGRVGGLRWFIGAQKWVLLGAALAALGLAAGLWVLLAPENGGGHEDIEAPVVTEREVMRRAVVKAPDGLVVRDVKADFVEDAKEGTVFVVKGLMQNTGSAVLTVPAFQVEILDRAGQVADVWPAAMPHATLDAGEVMDWEVSFTHPPVEEMAGWRGNFVK
jgi:hypothetical protein